MNTKDELVLDRTLALEGRAQRVISCVTQTASKRPQAFVPGRFPTYLSHGRGSRVWDVDGNEYIDCFMACGPVLLGYCYPAVDEAIAEQLRKGIILSRPTILEIEVAELLTEMIPCAATVRFLKGGAEANSAALRMARVHTGRDVAVTCGYRGWHDQWAVLSRLEGVPCSLEPLTVGFAFNDLGSLRSALEGHPDQVAAVIIDPVAKDAPEPGFLGGVKELAHRHGAVLIFDEIVTGFRVAKGGAQEHYGVVPDLAVFAKGIANGMPLSAVVGHQDLVKAGDRISLTYGDEALSLAAAKAALSEQLSHDVCGHIWRLGQALMDGLQAAISATGVPFEIGAIAPMASFVETDRFQGRSLDAEDRQRAWLYLLAELARRGVIHRRNSSFLLSYSHTDQDVAQVVSAFGTAFAELGRLLEGGRLREKVAYRPPPAFRRL